MPNEVKLLPCAFCGVSDCLTMPSYASGKWVQCNNAHCQAEGPVADTREQAIHLWNHRPTTVVTDEAVERVARALAACASRHGTLCEGEQPEDSWEAWEEEARAALASMPTVVTGEQPEGLGDHALPPSGLSPCGSQASPAAAIARKEP